MNVGTTVFPVDMGSMICLLLFGVAVGHLLAGFGLIVIARTSPKRAQWRKCREMRAAYFQEQMQNGERTK